MARYGAGEGGGWDMQAANISAAGMTVQNLITETTSAKIDCSS